MKGAFAQLVKGSLFILLSHQVGASGVLPEESVKLVPYAGSETAFQGATPESRLAPSPNPLYEGSPTDREPARKVPLHVLIQAGYPYVSYGPVYQRDLVRPPLGYQAAAGQLPQGAPPLGMGLHSEADSLEEDVEMGQGGRSQRVAPGSRWLETVTHYGQVPDRCTTGQACITCGAATLIVGGGISLVLLTGLLVWTCM